METLLRGTNTIAETVLDDYVSSLEKQHSGHVKDVQDESDFYRRDAIISSLSPKPTLGMRREGTMRKMGSIPMEVWIADLELRPSIPSKQRAKELLRRYPQFSIR